MTTAKKIVLEQLAGGNYWVRETTNTINPRVSTMLTEADVKRFIALKFTVVVKGR